MFPQPPYYPNRFTEDALKHIPHLEIASEITFNLHRILDRAFEKLEEEIGTQPINKGYVPASMFMWNWDAVRDCWVGNYTVVFEDEYTGGTAYPDDNYIVTLGNMVSYMDPHVARMEYYIPAGVGFMIWAHLDGKDEIEGEPTDDEFGMSWMSVYLG